MIANLVVLSSDFHVDTVILSPARTRSEHHAATMSTDVLHSDDRQLPQTRLVPSPSTCSRSRHAWDGVRVASVVAPRESGSELAAMSIGRLCDVVPPATAALARRTRW